ncbi:RTA1 like protein-domain-containing protein [Fusarium flagelliforme]|uniref:RTA1 like protein-domain-containing protein n=1 Tax=Fusarium flagelliforme TaxID=2675880 RepID=UPI001E8E4BE7|nr:RTA1 like protein-domain-containing protein [Fusarium flagelliforme]KAH7196513.1 RTA1 like protein-domain-containing protein [Fusarium flagelliforme]
MARLKPFKGNYYLWEYVPSLPGATSFAIAFLLITLAQGHRMYRGKHWFTIPFFIGGICEVFGYVFRTLAYNATNSLAIYIMQSLFLLLPPVFFAATLYMVYSRIVRAVGGEEFSLITVRKTTRLFVIGDFITFNIQGNGGGLLANQKLANIGKIIVIVGLIAQIILFLAFVIICVVFHRRFRAHLRRSHALVEVRWESYLHMLYITSASILVRNIFRVVEFIMDKEGYLMQKEWPTFVFDAVLMFLVMVAFYVWYPGNLASTSRDSTVELVPKRGNHGRETGSSD